MHTFALFLRAFVAFCYKHQYVLFVDSVRWKATMKSSEALGDRSLSPLSWKGSTLPRGFWWNHKFSRLSLQTSAGISKNSLLDPCVRAFYSYSRFSKFPNHSQLFVSYLHSLSSLVLITIPWLTCNRNDRSQHSYDFIWHCYDIPFAAESNMKMKKVWDDISLIVSNKEVA